MPTLGEIAGLVGGETSSSHSSLEIKGVADLAQAGPDRISFLGNPRYLKAAKSTRAAAVLVAHDFTETLPCPVIRVDNPSAAFAKVVAIFTVPAPVFQPGIHPSAVVADDVVLGECCHVGPHAVVEPGCRVGNRVHIGAGSYLGHGTVIGDETFLHPRATLRERSVVGRRVVLHSGVVIGSDGFGYEFQNGKHEKIPQVGYVQIDDDVEIGANSCIDRGRFDRTWIKDGSKIDNLVQIAHNVQIGPHAIVVAQCGISGSSSLGAYVVMGGQSATVGHVKVGDRVTLAAWTAVTKDINEPGVYQGGPARPIKEYQRKEASLSRLPVLVQKIRQIEEKLSG